MDPRTASWKNDGEFKPDQTLKAVQYLGLLLFILIAIMSWFIPLMVVAPLEVIIFLSVVLIPILAMVAIFIPLSYRNTSYKLNESEIVWKRGILFKRETIVPYTKITNVDISQGSLARYFGIATLNIQTAGFHAANSAMPEMRISGVKEHEHIREAIMGRVHSSRPVASLPEPNSDFNNSISAGPTVGPSRQPPEDHKNVNEQILTELVKISELLEKRK